MEKKTISRRQFLKEAGAISAGVMLAGYGLKAQNGLSAKSYSQVMGANDRVYLAFVGLNGRGNSLLGTVGRSVKNVEATYLCDVDTNVLAKAMKTAEKAGYSPKTERDFRRLLDNKDIDAFVHATPDHWHAIGAIMCAQAGKHSYVEKPLSHNPAEGELLVEAMKKYNVLVHMGSQRRSFPVIQEAMGLLHEGVIGDIYMGKSWYVNKRDSLSIAPASVPGNLDWDLWQGPAPRREYMDGYVHYNWHWFWNWGTGEALNNGTHEIDLLLWGTQAAFPTKVSSAGGKFAYQDAWETPDTQTITWELPGLILTWEGRSRNGLQDMVSMGERGVIFYGTKGSMRTGGNDYTIFNRNGSKIQQKKAGDMVISGQDTTSPSVHIDAFHLTNFVDAVRGKVKSNCTADIGHKSTTYVQLGNIAQRVGHSLKINPENGHIIGDREAQALWSRKYEKGWKPKI